MSVFSVETPGHSYRCIVERGVTDRLSESIPSKAGKVFVVTERPVWELHGERISSSLKQKPEVLFFRGGEERKRLSEVETMAEEMVQRGADRSSIVVAFGGGIVNDLGGFLAAIFMRGVPVIQVPTTLLAQVDAGIGGKTGANLVSGKNLIGSFHQPLAVLIDPALLDTLPPREFRAGLYEILKAGIIRSEPLFDRMHSQAARILATEPALVDEILSESVRIKAEVVSGDEKEADIRRILNYGHTIGHALESETRYSRFLHGEAVAFGMRAVTHLARLTNILPGGESTRMLSALDAYGGIPSVEGIQAESLVARLGADKKTVQGKVHFVLAERVGAVRVVTGLPDSVIQEATEMALADLVAASR